MSTTDPDLALPRAPFDVIEEPPGTWPAVLGRLDRRRRRRRLAAVTLSVAMVVAAAGVVAVVDRTPAPAEVAAARIEVGNRLVIRSLPEGWEFVDRTSRAPDPGSPAQMTSDSAQFLAVGGIRVGLRANQLGDGGRFQTTPGEPLPNNVTAVEVRGHPAERHDLAYDLDPGPTSTRSVQYSWNEDPVLSVSVSAVDDTAGADQATLQRAATDLIDQLEVLPLTVPVRRAGPAMLSGSTPSEDVAGPGGPLPSTRTVPVVATAVNNRREIRLVYYPSRLADGREVGCLVLLSTPGGERSCQDLPRVGAGLFGTVSTSPLGGDGSDVVWGFAPAGTAVMQITVGVDTQEFAAFRHASLPDTGVFWIAHRTGSFAAATSTEGLRLEALDSAGLTIATQVLRPQ